MKTSGTNERNVILHPVFVRFAASFGCVPEVLADKILAAYVRDHQDEIHLKSGAASWVQIEAEKAPVG